MQIARNRAEIFRQLDGFDEETIPACEQLLDVPDLLGRQVVVEVGDSGDDLHLFFPGLLGGPNQGTTLCQ